jgi:hypothetical protein
MGNVRNVGPDGDRMWRRLLALEDRRVSWDDKALEERVRQATGALQAEVEDLRERVSVLEGDTGTATAPHRPKGTITLN